MIQDKRLNDKEYRKRLVGRYLEAETTIGEETALAGYYAANEPDEDEIPAAMLLKMSAPDIVSEYSAKEFDRIVEDEERISKNIGMRTRWISVLAGSAAAVFALLFFLHAGRTRDIPEWTMSTAEMAGCIQDMMAICGDDISSVAVRPSGAAAMVTANMKNGTSRKYIMTYNDDDGSASFIALSE